VPTKGPTEAETLLSPIGVSTESDEAVVAAIVVGAVLLGGAVAALVVRARRRPKGGPRRRSSTGRRESETASHGSNDWQPWSPDQHKSGQSSPLSGSTRVNPLFEVSRVQSSSGRELLGDSLTRGGTKHSGTAAGLSAAATAPSRSYMDIAPPPFAATSVAPGYRPGGSPWSGSTPEASAPPSRRTSGGPITVLAVSSGAATADPIRRSSGGRKSNPTGASLLADPEPTAAEAPAPLLKGGKRMKVVDLMAI